MLFVPWRALAADRSPRPAGQRAEARPRVEGARIRSRCVCQMARRACFRFGDCATFIRIGTAATAAHTPRLYRLLLGRSASGSARRIEISPAHGAAVAFGAFGAGRCAGRANTRATAMVAQPPANRHSVSTGHRSCLSAEKSACTRQATPQQSENIRACAWYEHGEWLVGVE